MNVLGLSAFYHESSCCLLRDGRLVAAASEERFSRVKHDPRLPVEAFRFCLEAGRLSPADLDAVAYYEEPAAKHARQLWALEQATGSPEEAAQEAVRLGLDPAAAERSIRERLGLDGPWRGAFLTFPHHLSHAASAYYFSGFPEAAVLTIDGVGEWATTAYGRGAEDDLDLFEEVRFPHSLGLFYSTVAAYLGFRVNGGEGKVMGLAPYGRPRFVEQLRQVVRDGLDGGFTLDLAYFDFISGRRMVSDALVDLLGVPPRRREDEILPAHADLAASAQAVLEEILVAKARYLHTRVPSDSLCLAGGVALNCVANGRLLEETPFTRLFVPPAPGDAGAALGAAALAHRALTGRAPARAPLPHAGWGPRWSGGEVERLVAATGLPAEGFAGREAALVDAVAERLAGGAVVGWFQGAMELGPRALGARSILASPLAPEMRGRLNHQVKRREGFRPFAPMVLAERAADHFALEQSAPFMNRTCRVASPLALPAVTHVDGSARPQTVDRATHPRLAALLDAFARRTGCPVLLNTSFNVRGEPIVCSPADALFTFADAGLDLLVLEDSVLDRARMPAGWRELLGAWRGDAAKRPGGGGSAVSETIYTFV